MKKRRISIVEYLNTAPLVWGFTDGPLTGKYELSSRCLSQCAESCGAAMRTSRSFLRSNTSGSRAWSRIAGHGDRGEARGAKPAGGFAAADRTAKKIALDTSSRATQALVRILAEEHWDIQPEFVQAAPDPAEMLRIGRRGAGDRRSRAANRDEDGSAGI